MNLALALLLAAQAGTVPQRTFDFQEMLDSAQLVVIAKVDSIWYPMEPGFPYTHVMAELLTVYVQDTSCVPRSDHIEIAFGGGRKADGGWLYMFPHPSFTEGEIFLAALQLHPYFYPKGFDIYYINIWKYTISNDSLFFSAGGGIASDDMVKPLGEVLEALPEAFTKVQQ
jgi:hypothetical protein